MKSKLQLLLALAALASTSSFLWAQSVRGTILGTIVDPSGSVLAKAKVTVREVATGLMRSELTGETGEYSIPQLPAGIYDLTVEQASFKKAERKAIELRIDDRLRIDVTLTLGNVSETVEVEGVAPR
jgi:Carboxypeptidase regulatory-like domain